MDESISRSASQVLVGAGHDVDLAVAENLRDASGTRVRGRRSRHRTPLLITLDRGLVDIRAIPPGSHVGIVVLRPPNQSAKTVAALAEMVVAHELTTLPGIVTIAQRGLLRSRDRHRRSIQDHEATHLMHPGLRNPL